MKFFSLLLFGLLTLTVSAQTEQQLVAKADALEASLNEVGAFETFKQVARINPKNHYALWKLSELCSRIGNRQPTKAAKQQYFTAGMNYAAAAIKANPGSADGYYVMSVAIGRLALSGSGKEKIDAVKEIRANAEKALKINPQHGRAWHVIGKWNYEVSDLNFIERAGVKLMYGGLPPASIKASIQAYEKAKLYETNFALNYLELAKAYKRDGQREKAIALLRALPGIQAKTIDDAKIKTEGAALLKDWTD
jgi:tetratricopeptide (TPR) repeat protein